jgi:hypothetical protein
MKTKKKAMAKPQQRNHTQNFKSSGERPLAWWRTIPAEEFDPSRVTILRATLSTIAILEEPTWRSAAGGNAAAAIGLALRLNPARSTGFAYDLIASALAICAADGNAAASLVMSHTLRKAPAAGKAEARIATSWLTHAFSEVISRQAGTTNNAEQKGAV